MYIARVLSFGGGFYVATYSNEVGKEVSRGGGRVGSSLTIKNAGIVRHDYGLVASIAVYTPISSRMKLTVDGRYTLGLKNDDITDFGILKFNDLQLLAGLRVSF